MVTVSTNQGKSFGQAEGQSILDAGLLSGVPLPYSCRMGRCSSCKCKVIKGTSTSILGETGLTDEEKAQGWILSCARSATSDMTLEVDDLGGIALPQVKTLPARIDALEKLAPDVVRVVLRLPPSSDFQFIPGQYIDVIGPGGMRRSYSLANANAASKLFELHIRAVEDGAMSNYWFNQAKVNDLLRLNGPLGTFFLRDVASLDLILLATGTGIAPVKAILEGLPDVPTEQAPRSITVLWGGRNPSDLYFNVSILPGAQRYVPVLSRSNEDWPGARGYVQNVLLTLQPELSKAAVYACGSDAMIHSAKKILTEAGLPERRFYSDAFVCSAST